MDELLERNEVAMQLSDKLLELQERYEIARVSAERVLREKELTEQHENGITRLVLYLRDWFSSKDESLSDEELNESHRLVNELLAEVNYLSELYRSVGVHDEDKRILKLCSEYGSHLQPLPRTYSALCEMIDNFFGIPDEREHVFVVSYQDIHITTDFELEYVYGQNKDVNVVELFVSTAKASKKRKRVSMSPEKPNPILKSTPWLRSEERLLDDVISKFGTDDWELIAKHVKTRSSEGCRA